MDSSQRMKKRIQIRRIKRDSMPLMVEIPTSLDDRMRRVVVKSGKKLWEWISEAIEGKLSSDARSHP